MSTVVSIDAGTTGVRAVAVDEHGRITHRAYREFPQYFPRPGWVEHDAAEIWQATQTVLAELAPQLTGAVAAIGITDQRETVVAWNRRTGAPACRAIVWQDRRTADRCDQLVEEGHLPMIRRRTGLVLDPYFSASKIEWLLTEGGLVPDSDTVIGTVDSWLLWNLSGGAVHATDTTNASRTMLFDLRELAWSEELCDLFGVPMSLLPEVRPSAGRFGVSSDACPLGARIPLSGVAGDQQASLFGQACFSPGMTKNTYGTGSFVLMNVGDTCPEPTEGLLTTVAWTLDPEIGGGDSPSTAYALEGAIFVTGAAIQWLRDGLGIIADAAEAGPLAESVADTGGVVVVPAFTGLGSPYWDPRARGTILGLTRGTGRAQITRAVVESMAYSTRDVVDAMASSSGRQPAQMRVDGGASVMDLLCRIQADQIGVRVARSAESETTALGSAFLAGLAEGVWDSTSVIDRVWTSSGDFDPVEDRTAADAAYAQWRRAVDRSRAWATD